MSETMLDRLVDAVMADEAWSSFWSRHECKALVRAALAELREPTDAMLAAGSAPNLILVERWQAMIDTALKDERP